MIDFISSIVKHELKCQYRQINDVLVDQTNIRKSRTDC